MALPLVRLVIYSCHCLLANSAEAAKGYFILLPALAVPRVRDGSLIDIGHFLREDFSPQIETQGIWQLRAPSLCRCRSTERTKLGERERWDGFAQHANVRTAGVKCAAWTSGRKRLPRQDKLIGEVSQSSITTRKPTFSTF